MMGKVKSSEVLKELSFEMLYLKLQIMMSSALQIKSMLLHQ
jgi:hypothetical protein